MRRDAGLARWRRLQASCAATRAALEAAVAGESFEGAEALQGELEAAGGEAERLLQQWGFSDEERVVAGLQELQAGGAGPAAQAGAAAAAAEEQGAQEGEGAEVAGEEVAAEEELAGEEVAAAEELLGEPDEGEEAL